MQVNSIVNTIIFMEVVEIWNLFVDWVPQEITDSAMFYYFVGTYRLGQRM